jgi:Protein of unknown function (DUF3040)
MSLTARDRRALRDIERHLHADDPTLARLLRVTPGRRGGATGVVARAAWAVLWSAVVLVIAGLVLSSSSTMIGGLLLLATFPIVVWLIAAATDVAQRARRRDR